MECFFVTWGMAGLRICLKTRQYIDSVSRMLPSDRLKVLPSLLLAPPPSLFFFLFQLSSDAE